MKPLPFTLIALAAILTFWASISLLCGFNADALVAGILTAALLAAYLVQRWREKRRVRKLVDTYWATRGVRS